MKYNTAKLFQRNLNGLSELSQSDYEQFIKDVVLRGHDRDLNSIFKKVLAYYLYNDPNDDWCWDCQDDMEEIFEAFQNLTENIPEEQTVGGGYVSFMSKYGLELPGLPPGLGVENRDRAQRMSIGLHFWAGAAYAANYTEYTAYNSAFIQEMSDALFDASGYSREDLAWTMKGANFVDYFDRSEAECRELVQLFVSGAFDLKTYVAMTGTSFMDTAIIVMKQKCKDKKTSGVGCGIVNEAQVKSIVESAKTPAKRKPK